MKNSSYNANGSAAQPALLFIPDISGFTRFVTDTEISHSQHIIRELLEILIESNQIGLEVSEVEGDAILFYRFGSAPTAAELLAQVQKMFVSFHQHLRMYESHRICQCGACRSANDLTLKFVTHYGDIALNQIKQHAKLFGKDVIVAHRLLKNGIPHHEYALVTGPLVKACPQWVDIPVAAWADVEHGEETYDSGDVKYCYLALAPLMEHVKDVPLPSPVFKGRAVLAMVNEAEYDHPAEEVFQTLVDLPNRTAWMTGVTDVMWLSKGKINRTGTLHRCVLGDKSNPEVVTEGFAQNERSFCFSESDAKGNSTAKYIFEKTSDTTSRLRMEVWLKDSFILKLMFKWMMEKKFTAMVKSSLENLTGFLKKQEAEAGVPQGAVA